MWLVGLVDPTLNFIERGEVVSTRLQRVLGPSASELSPEFFAMLTELVTDAQSQIAAARSDTKAGLSNTAGFATEQILRGQHYRCAVCGVPLRSRVQRTVPSRDGALEPLADPHLDHIRPFYWGANNGNLRILCSHCNVVKSDFIGVHEDGLVLCGNHVRRRLAQGVERRAIFWTLVFQSHKTPPTGLVFARRSDPDGPWVYGNIEAVPLEASAPEDVWLHEESRPIR